jgi:hypothetical protein
VQSKKQQGDKIRSGLKVQACSWRYLPSRSVPTPPLLDTSQWVKNPFPPSTPNNSSKSFCLTAALLTEWLSYLVDNTFISFASAIRRQAISLPMGTNCAVYVANLFLFTYELAFIESLLHDFTEINKQKLSALLRTGRFVDDLLSLNNSEFEALLLVIYPPAMLTVTQADAGPSVDFLDMHIFQDTTTPSKPFVTSLYDKRRENKFRPLHLVRFPHIKSLISDSARYGIVTSQFHRFRRIITRPHFIREMASFLHEPFPNTTHPIDYSQSPTASSKSTPTSTPPSPGPLWSRSAPSSPSLTFAPPTFTDKPSGEPHRPTFFFSVRFPPPLPVCPPLLALFLPSPTFFLHFTGV